MLQSGHVRDQCLEGKARICYKRCLRRFRQGIPAHSFHLHACMVSLHAHMLESFACAGMNLAEAALQVAAEDDALVSHSSVQLPVQSFLNRISRLANDVNTLHLRSLPPGSSPQEALQVSPSQSQKRLSCSRKAHLLQGTPVLPRCFCQVDVSSHERWHKRIM